MEKRAEYKRDDLAAGISGRDVLVVGAGSSGIASCELLIKKGARVTLYDGKEDLDAGALREKYPALRDVPIILGEQWREGICAPLSLAVVSPGVPTDIPLVGEIRGRGIPIWGEMELAYNFSRGRVVAITGTNGKTTTTSLVGEILSRHFKDVRVVGNIGIPFASVADDTDDDTIAVAEVSSFQLETISAFHPAVSAILNITPDHLDRHHTMEAYIEAKERVALNQGPQDACVLNYEDPVLRAFGERASADVLFFSGKRVLERGVYLDGGAICYAQGGASDPVRVAKVDELQILGEHNWENAMAAVGIAASMGVPIEVIAEGLREFKPVEHRIEFVAEKGGVRYYNDSKGTNTDAAIKGICAMTRPTLLIGGGYDKQAEYDEWVERFPGRVKELVLIGETRDKIAECARRHGFMDIALCDSLEEAVGVCARDAAPGDAVLLSPACASWDMFRNYEERGRLFKECVGALA